MKKTSWRVVKQIIHANIIKNGYGLSKKIKQIQWYLLKEFSN
jgi:hypothetical protein